MPEYNYSCPNCGEEFCKDLPIGSAPEKTKCPKCGKRAERDLSGNYGVIFKGGGWPGQEIKRSKDMNARNASADRRMRDRYERAKPVAYDYGGGDVRDAKDVKK